MLADNLKCLIIDDQKAMRSIVRDLLSKLGIHQIQEAENGRAAMDFLFKENQKPDFIISDLYMDKIDGMNFVNQLRKNEDLRDLRIPVILLTGETDSFVLDVSRQVGVCHILNKPCTVAELGKAVTKAVGFTVSPLKT